MVTRRTAAVTVRHRPRRAVGGTVHRRHRMREGIARHRHLPVRAETVHRRLVQEGIGRHLHRMREAIVRHHPQAQVGTVRHSKVGVATVHSRICAGSGQPLATVPDAVRVMAVASFAVYAAI